MKRATAIICAAAICAAGTPFYGCAPQESEGTKYRITAAYDGGNTLEGRVETDFYNDTGNALDCLKFNLWGNAFREGAASSPVSEAAKADAYYGGESYGGMEIFRIVLYFLPLLCLPGCYWLSIYLTWDKKKADS